MRKVKRLISVIAATSIIVTCLGSNTGLKANAVVDDTNDDWLHCKGDKIYDMYGNEVWLTGVNWFGFNCSENCFHGAEYDVKIMLKSIADRGINFLRIPISTELLNSWMIGEPNKVSSVTACDNPPYYVVNPLFYDKEKKAVKNSMEIFDIIMGFCKELGIKVMVDIHSPHADNSGHNYELWYGKETKTAGVVTTEMWMDTLVWLADKYKNDDTILALDLKNEPHGKRGYSVNVPEAFAKWNDSKDENNWKNASQECAKAILKKNPKLLIMIEGIEQYPKTEKGFTYDTPDIWDASPETSPWYPAWWGGNLRGVKDYPIDVGELNSQIVYSPHDYGPSVYAQKWFDKDFTTQTLLDDYWYDSWAYIDDKGIAPLFIGEWGGGLENPKNKKWMELLRDYMVEKRINHTFWCFNPNSGDTGGLTIGWTKWDEEKYSIFEKALWKTEDGKYISLDHKVPMGVNGISLGEYTGNETPETTPVPTKGPTDPNTGSKISGYISPDLSNIPEEDSLKKSFKIELLGTELSAETDEKGYFEISNIPDDIEDLSIKITKPGFLARTMNDIEKDSVIGTSDNPVHVWVGDINEPQDDSINMSDVIYVAKVFNSIKGDGKYIEHCDTNLDGSINMSDIINLAKHFNATSASYPKK